MTTHMKEGETMDLSAFIKYIKLDDSKRILISVHEFLEPQLATPESKKMIKETVVNILGDDFKLLEIGKNVCRITVAEGTEKDSIHKLEEGIRSAIEMAMSFMDQNSEEAPIN